MADKFAEVWEGKLGGIKGAVRRIRPLRDQIQNAIRKIENQLSRIDREIEEYNRRERDLSEKLLQAYEKHHIEQAEIFANELAEIRKHKDLLMTSKISLDRAMLRLHTICEIGDFTSIILSAKKSIGETRLKIADFIPGVDLELSRVEEMLDNIMAKTCENAKIYLSPDVPESEEIERILEEAAIVAENRVKTTESENQKRN